MYAASQLISLAELTKYAVRLEEESKAERDRTVLRAYKVALTKTAAYPDPITSFEDIAKVNALFVSTLSV